MATGKKAVLWKLNREGSTRTSYLFGTMHVKDDIAFSHNELALEKLSHSNLVACEYNLNEAQGRGFGEAFMFPNGQNLRDYVTPKKYKRMSKIMFNSFGLDLDQFQFLLPMTTMNVLSETILQKDNNVSLDQFIWDKGIELGLEQDGLESFNGQLEIMGKIDVEYQVQMLYAALRNVKKFRKGLFKLVELYRNQEIHKLFKLSKKSLGAHKNLLLYNRNLNMSKKIIYLSEKHNAFYAVGAAHLSGKKGLLHLLKSEGFKLTPCH